MEIKTICAYKFQHLIRFNYRSNDSYLRHKPEYTRDVGAKDTCRVAFFSIGGNYDESIQLDIDIADGRFFKFQKVKHFKAEITDRLIDIPAEWYGEYRLYTRKVKLAESIPGFKPKHNIVWMQIAIPENNVMFDKAMEKMQSELNSKGLI